VHLPVAQKKKNRHLPRHRALTVAARLNRALRLRKPLRMLQNHESCTLWEEDLVTHLKNGQKILNSTLFQSSINCRRLLKLSPNWTKQRLRLSHRLSLLTVQTRVHHLLSKLVIFTSKCILQQMQEFAPPLPLAVMEEVCSEVDSRTLPPWQKPSAPRTAV